MLLLPPELLPTAFSRDEIVALFNTLASFSAAIEHVKEMSNAIYKSYYTNPPPSTTTTADAGSAMVGKTPPSQQPPPPPSPPMLSTTTPTTLTPQQPLSQALPQLSARAQPAPMVDPTLLDTALSHLAAASRSGSLTPLEEAAAVKLALSSDYGLLLTCRHFGGTANFASHVRSAILAASIAPSSSSTTTTANAITTTPSAPSVTGPDVVVIGTGVAGMTTALRLLDRGARVILLDKETKVGGNSAKASSGINGCCPTHSRSDSNSADSVDAFAADTAKSALREPTGLIALLAQKSASTLEWLMSRVAVDLSKISQLGGHKHARTHRPANGMVGAELTFALHRELKAYVKSGMLELRTGCKLTGFILSDSAEATPSTSTIDNSAAAARASVLGIRYTNEKTGEKQIELYSPQTVLATGGYANDRTNTSLLALHRPDLVPYPTTNGPWATGDGMKIAMGIGADTIDMDRVQIHPTGFVDPTAPDASTKVLCGEMMRGVGGILLTSDGKRFVNELAPRDKVVDGQLKSGSKEFAIVLNQAMATEAGKHVELYLKKGLLTKVSGAEGLAAWMASDVGVRGASSIDGSSNASSTAPVQESGVVSALSKAIRGTLASYSMYASAEKEAIEDGIVDPFGKTSFRHAPIDAESVLYAGRIVPVLHYTMGGIKMDSEGRVLRADGSVIENLSAAGEVTGGVHGNNRLGGNSLLECAVFGSIVGNRLPIASKSSGPSTASTNPMLGAGTAGSGLPSLTVADAPAAAATEAAKPDLRKVSKEELSAHTTAESCWVALHGVVYDFTAFLDEHPPGAESILKLGGTDGTEMYETVHNIGMLSDFEADIVGAYDGS